MKRVRASAEGYDNITIRAPGEEFDMPDDAVAPWFDDASVPIKEAPKPQGQTQDATTLLGIQKQQAGKDDLI